MKTILERNLKMDAVITPFKSQIFKVKNNKIRLPYIFFISKLILFELLSVNFKHFPNSFVNIMAIDFL